MYVDKLHNFKPEWAETCSTFSSSANYDLFTIREPRKTSRFRNRMFKRWLYLPRRKYKNIDLFWHYGKLERLLHWLGILVWLLWSSFFSTNINGIVTGSILLTKYTHVFPHFLAVVSKTSEQDLTKSQFERSCLWNSEDSFSVDNLYTKSQQNTQCK